MDVWDSRASLAPGLTKASSWMSDRRIEGSRFTQLELLFIRLDFFHCSLGRTLFDRLNRAVAIRLRFVTRS